MAFPRPLTAPYAGSPSPSPASAVIVITTFNRLPLLRRLIASIEQDSSGAGGVVVVDNASSDGTGEFLASLGPELHGREGREIPLRVIRQPENLGGAGGFRAGIAAALSDESLIPVPVSERWAWVMDDDVEVLDGALARLCKRGLTADVIHGQRINPDGTDFFWRHRLDPATGIHLPLPEPQRSAPVTETNVACFEGALISARTVELVGLPDAQFFIASDDTTYGYLASRRVRVVVCDEPLLRKTRSQKSVSLAVRHLNDSSDLSRYYTVRNRALMKGYIEREGELSPFAFAAGTALTAAKELVRTALVEMPGAMSSGGATAAGRSAVKSLRAVGAGLKDGARLSLRPLPLQTAPRPSAAEARQEEPPAALSILLLGASGFVGSAVRTEAERRGHRVQPWAAPRLAADALEQSALPDALLSALKSADAVVNAAGLASPDGAQKAALFGANAVLPGLLADACAASVPPVPLVHLSSAAVLGAGRLSAAAPPRPFSDYSRSKAEGEERVRQAGGTFCILRATSVQGPGRRTTERFVRLARSPWASWASDSPTPLTSVTSLARLTVGLAEDLAAGRPVPPVVLQPWEGATTRTALEAARGGHSGRPLRLPRWAGCLAVKAGSLAARLPGALGQRSAAVSRRLDLLWFGQSQADEWPRAHVLAGPSDIHEMLRSAGR